MSETKSNLSKWLHIRLKEEDYKKIKSRFSKSTCRKLSEYARRILLDKVITVNQRNQSLDDFMAEMIRLRSELNAIAKNLNQSVKKLHAFHQIHELKNWLIEHEVATENVLGKVAEIKNKINQISDIWLR